MKWQVPVVAITAGVIVFLGARALKASGPGRIVVIGDSMVGGAAFKAALLEQVPSGSSVSIYSYPGQGSNYILGRLSGALQGNPTHVVVLAGVNDLASGRPSETVKGNLNEMYREIEAAGAKPIGVQLTPWRGHVNGAKYQAQTLSVNAWIQSQGGVRWVNTGSLGSDNGTLKADYNGGDGLHLSAEGQRALASMVAKAI